MREADRHNGRRPSDRPNAPDYLDGLREGGEEGRKEAVRCGVAIIC